MMQVEAARGHPLYGEVLSAAVLCGGLAYHRGFNNGSVYGSIARPGALQRVQDTGNY